MAQGRVSVSLPRAERRWEEEEARLFQPGQRRAYFANAPKSALRYLPCPWRGVHTSLLYLRHPHYVAAR